MSILIVMKKIMDNKRNNEIIVWKAMKMKLTMKSNDNENDISSNEMTAMCVMKKMKDDDQ
jgi:hypothetical protein